MTVDDNGVYGAHSSPRSEDFQVFLDEQGRVSVINRKDERDTETRSTPQTSFDHFVIRRQYSWTRKNKTFHRMIAKVEHEGKILQFAIVQYTVNMTPDEAKAVFANQGIGKKCSSVPQVRMKQSVLERMREMGDKNSAKQIINKIQKEAGGVVLQQKEELRALKQEGAVLRKQLQRQKAVFSKSSMSTSAPSTSAAVHVHVSATESCLKILDDLRNEETLQDRVAQRLAQLDVEDDSSSDGTYGQDENSNDSNRASSRSTGKSLRSGKTVKPTSKVVRPQSWPHSELDVAACSNDVTHDQLTIEEFVAGYTTILHSRKLATTEKQARGAHLTHLMYLAMTYEWQAVLAYHGAVILPGLSAWHMSLPE